MKCCTPFFGISRIHLSVVTVALAEASGMPFSFSNLRMSTQPALPFFPQLAVRISVFAARMPWTCGHARNAPLKFLFVGHPSSARLGTLSLGDPESWPRELTRAVGQPALVRAVTWRAYYHPHFYFRRPNLALRSATWASSFRIAFAISSAGVNWSTSMSPSVKNLMLSSGCP